ncbi:MAG: prenyltransferase/squalene oxidase repeat-containing protein [Candidatus Binatia bacterium]
MINEAITLLLSSQNSDGGWGATQGKRSNTENTAIAVAALTALSERSAAEGVSRGTHWLLQHQNQDGSWPLNDAAKEGSWTSGLAIIALSAFPEHQESVRRAARWLLLQEGSKPGLLARIILFVTGKSNINDLNNDLIGWSWVPNSFSWVEPTSYALIALKKARPLVSESNVIERINRGEAVIYDRMCKEGGWNYGNSKVLDYALWPYPDITAVALIALQDHSGATANQTSLASLRKTARETDSGLALSWGTICLGLYGQKTDEWKALIAKRFEKTRFLGETKTLALSIIALNGSNNPFRI